MAHLTVALSEDAVRRSVDILVQSIAWEAQDDKDFGAFSAGYHIKGHLEGGAVDLRADNTIASAGISIGAATLYDRTGPVGTCVVTTLSNARRQIDFSTNPLA